MRSVCVFCGSRRGAQPGYQSLAQALGQALVSRGIRLVYGGAGVGLMGWLADTVLAGGGQVVGVIPRTLVDRELAHSGLTELHVVDTLHQRKALMADFADGFIALPGGVGTLDELFEIITWRVLDLHAKPIGLLDDGIYWEPLTRLLDHMVDEGFLDLHARELVRRDSDPDRLLVSMS
ncbi:MAG TPA: TIGR00730 family Rossman fold protein [Kofleriaceae bacterium]|nr:TIGR00730 family Rossman fold protein [Kofleriaceae bacterium]